MILLEISPLEVQKDFPAFFHRNSRFFALHHDNNDVGLYGIQEITRSTCKIALLIFEKYRFKIPYRKMINLVLRYPYSCGFDIILISTIKKSVATLLYQCHKLGVRFLGYSSNKIWFKAERIST